MQSFSRSNSLHPSIRSSQGIPAIPLALLAFAVLGLSISLIFLSLSHEEELVKEKFGGDSGWFNGDALYPLHLIDDVFVEENSLSGWLLPPAPFIVPDFVCAGISRLLTSEAALGMFITGVLLFLLVVVSAMYSARISSRHSNLTTVLMTAAAALIAVGIAWGGTSSQLRFLFLPAYHTGTFALALLLMGMGIHLAVDDGHRRPALLCFFLAASLCAGFSDVMTIAFVSAPLTAALVFGLMVKLVSVRRFAIVAGIIWAAPILGHYICHLTLRVNAVRGYSTISIEIMAKCASIFFKGLVADIAMFQPFTLLAVGWIVLSWLWIAAWLRDHRRRGFLANDVPIADRRKVLLILGLSLSGPAAISSLIVGGNYFLLGEGYAHISRYLHPFLYAPWLFWPVLIPDSFQSRIAQTLSGKVAMRLGMGTVTLLLAANVRMGFGPHPLHNYVPAYVQKLEQIASERGLRHGLAYYWTARDVNMFAKNGLRVFAVDPEMKYIDWMNNRTWVFGPFDDHNPAPQPEFVVISPMEPYTKAQVVAHFGEPAADLPLDETDGTRRVLIYDRAEDIALRDHFTNPALIWCNGFYGLESDGVTKWRWCASQGVLVIDNPTTESKSVDIQFDLMSARTEDVTISIQSPYFEAEIAASPSGTLVSRTLTLPPGSHAFSFSTTAPPIVAPLDARQLVFQVRNFQMRRTPMAIAIGQEPATSK